MSKKPETNFRNNTVVPFLKQLKKTKFFSIQQTAICGDPDILLCVNSRFVALELKIPGEEPSPLQEHKLNCVREAGGVAVKVDPENWPIVKQLLTAISEGAS